MNRMITAVKKVLLKLVILVGQNAASWRHPGWTQMNSRAKYPRCLERDCGACGRRRLMLVASHIPSRVSVLIS
jgi:hypothetical protein